MQANPTSNQNSFLDIERLVHQYGKSLLRMSLVYLKDLHLAEDAVQETFIKAYTRYSTFQGASSEKTWITSIAIHTCKDMLKSAWKRHAEHSIPLDTIRIKDDNSDYEQNSVLLDAVLRLPPKLKEVILLFYYQDMCTKEISEALRITENTVRVRLNRARNKLKEQLCERID